MIKQVIFVNYLTEPSMVLHIILNPPSANRRQTLQNKPNNMVYSNMISLNCAQQFCCLSYTDYFLRQILSPDAN